MQLFHGTIHSLSTEIENSGTIAHLVARPFQFTQMDPRLRGPR